MDKMVVRAAALMLNMVDLLEQVTRLVHLLHKEPMVDRQAIMVVRAVEEQQLLVRADLGLMRGAQVAQDLILYQLGQPQQELVFQDIMLEEAAGDLTIIVEMVEPQAQVAQVSVEMDQVNLHHMQDKMEQQILDQVVEAEIKLMLVEMVDLV
jgi:hypothetical protein